MNNKCKGSRKRHYSHYQTVWQNYQNDKREVQIAPKSVCSEMTAWL